MVDGGGPKPQSWKMVFGEGCLEIDGEEGFCTVGVGKAGKRRGKV